MYGFVNSITSFESCNRILLFETFGVFYAIVFLIHHFRCYVLQFPKIFNIYKHCLFYLKNVKITMFDSDVYEYNQNKKATKYFFISSFSWLDMILNFTLDRFDNIYISTMTYVTYVPCNVWIMLSK